MRRPAVVSSCFAWVTLAAACIQSPDYDGLECGAEAPCPEGFECGPDGSCRQTCVVTADCLLSNRVCVSGVCAPVAIPVIFDARPGWEPDASSEEPRDAAETFADAEAGGADASSPSCVADTDCISPGRCELPDAAQCDRGRCVYVARVCETPPPAECTGGDATFRMYGATGICDPTTGACSYQAIDVACPRCRDTCLEPCRNVTCHDQNGGCRTNGMCMPVGPGQPARCVYTDLPDGAPCILAGGAPGVCSAARCVECASAGDCGDNNPCTDDACDAAAGRCTFTPNAAPCNDGNACTRADSCSGGACTGSSPVVCDQSPGACFSARGSCDPATGRCEYPADPRGTGCNDGDACTAPDICNGAGGCAGTPYSCNDGDACTSDACDGSGGCNHAIRPPQGLMPRNGQSLNTQTVTLSWTPCANATSYEAEIQFERADGTWYPYYTYSVTNPSQTFYPCSSAAPGRPCYGDFRFRVRAFIGGAWRAWSAFASWHWDACRAC